jgi:2-polyprenyl-6-methoxyphenol hydroxylase-like FAD-dependent oxidoreductase
VVRTLEAVPDWDQVNYAEAREVRARHWYLGAAFLVGDAAHAMLPDLGQGANSAMVDALVLVRLLARLRSERPTRLHPLPVATFYLPAPPAPLPPLERVGRSYEALRKPFVTRIQRTARQMGALASWTLPPARWARDALLRFTTRLPPLRRRMLALAAGVQEEEQSYLS